MTAMTPKFVIEGLELRLAQQGRDLAQEIKMNPAVDHKIIREHAMKRLEWLNEEHNKLIERVSRIIFDYDKIAEEIKQHAARAESPAPIVERERFIDSEDKIVIESPSRAELESLSLAWLKTYGGSLCLCNTNSRGFVATRGRIRGEWQLLGVLHAEKGA